MCSKKIQRAFEAVLQHICRRYRERAGCVVLKNDPDGKISVLMIESLGSTKKGKPVYKLAGEVLSRLLFYCTFSIEFPMMQQENLNLLFHVKAGGSENGESREFAAARETVEDIIFTSEE